MAWCLYDWAYGAFTVVVSTFVFATYFVRAVAADPATGTAQWAAAQTGAGLLVAVLAAPLGAIADLSGRKRSLLALFTAIMSLATIALWFVRPVVSDVSLALSLVAVATVAYELATVFYNAMLPDVASPARLGRVSGLGWSLGYGGGLSCLLICLVFLIGRHPPPFGLDPASAEPVRAAAVLAGVWIALFGWPVLVFVPDRGERRPWGQSLRNGLADLRRVMREAAADPALLRFLLARMIYTDGLTTLFVFGGIYAAGQFGMDARGTLLLGILLNVSAGVGAVGFAMIEDRIGAKPTVLIALTSLILFGAAMLATHDETVFWALAGGLGLFIGPAQSASRSLMARMAPAADRNVHFGLFALSGRVTGFVGPGALGIVTALTNSQRAGMSVILVLLVSGALLLLAVPVRPAPVTTR
ncbi:MAG: MFS transporter [Acetobacteraceae bacterium]|nr:MFS transporter [Acetobacteraceae bacterium]